MKRISERKMAPESFGYDGWRLFVSDESKEEWIKMHYKLARRRYDYRPNVITDTPATTEQLLKNGLLLLAPADAFAEK